MPLVPYNLLNNQSDSASHPRLDKLEVSALLKQLTIPTSRQNVPPLLGTAVLFEETPKRIRALGESGF